MTADLNLLPSSAKFQAERIRLRKEIRKLMIALGIIWVVIVVVVLGLWLVASMLLTASETKLKKAVTSYTSMSTEIIASQLLKYRAKILGGVLLGRFEYGKTIQRLNSLFPPEVVMDNFEVDNTKTFNLSGKVSGIKAVDVVENKINDVNSGQVEGFKSAKLTSLRYGNNIWKFSMEVVINEKIK